MRLIVGHLCAIAIPQFRPTIEENDENLADMSTSNKAQTARYDKARSLVIAAYRERWNDVLDGKSKAQNAGVFEAPTDSIQEIMARDFYARPHLQMLVALSDDAIVGNHLPLIMHLATQRETPLRSSLVKRLLGGQYVLFQCNHDHPCNFDSGCEVDLEQDDLDQWTAVSYPESVLYDDWYERVGGFYTTFVGVLMKSSGEPFSKSDRQHLAEAVHWNVISNDQSELWSFGFHVAGKRMNQIVISISGNAYGYREGLDDTLCELDTPTLKRIAAAVEPLRTDEESPFFDLIDTTTPSLRKASGKVIREVLRSCVRSATDPFDLNSVEHVIGAHFFGGRGYYHSYCEFTEGVGPYGFFNDI